MYRAAIISVFIGILIQPAFAQTDTHYWTHQYGAKGLLLNGAVIASPKDESSIFYNPGAIGQDDELGFSFSFLTPTFSTLQTNNLLGDDTSMRDNGFGLAPGFLAVRFHPFKTHKITAGVASFTRNKSSINYTRRLVGTSSDDSNLLFRGDFEFKRNLSENWFGVGLSFNLSDHLGIGFSQFSIWHNEGLQFKYVKELYENSAPDQVVLGIRNELGYDFSIYSSFLTKLGLAYQSEKIKFGLTFTSPSYSRIKNSASYKSDELTTQADSIYVQSNRRSIKVQDFKTPWSVGFGAELILEKIHVSFSTEYFRRINQYFVFNDADDPFDGHADRADEQIFGVAFGNQSVLNFALGFQRVENEKRTWLWGFRTDFNQRSRFRIIDNLEYLATTPDVFHFSGGGKFKYGKNVVSMGIDIGYGYRFGGAQLTDLSDITRDNIFITGQNDNVENRFQSIMLFLTYDFIFSHMKSL